MINRDSTLWERRDAKMMRLPLMKVVTIGQAASYMGIKRESFRSNYIKNCRYELPIWIERIYDGNRLIALRRTA